MFSPRDSKVLQKDDDQNSLRKPTMMDRVKYKLLANRSSEKTVSPFTESADHTGAGEISSQPHGNREEHATSNNDESKNNNDLRNLTDVKPFDIDRDQDENELHRSSGHSPKGVTTLTDQRPEISDSEHEFEEENHETEIGEGVLQAEVPGHQVLENELVIIGHSPSRCVAPHCSDKLSHDYKLENAVVRDNIMDAPKLSSSTRPRIRSDDMPAEIHTSSTRAHTKKQIYSDDIPILASTCTMDTGTDDTSSKEKHNANYTELDPAVSITQVFGERVARMISADIWQERQDGFDAIRYSILKGDSNNNTKSAREQFCALLAAVQCGLEDRVAPVMYCALECFLVAVDVLECTLESNRSGLISEQVLVSFIKAVILKCGDTNKRTKREAQQTLLKLMRMKNVDVSALPLPILKSLDITQRVQVDTLLSITKNLKNERFPNPIEDMLEIACSALTAADEKTRKAALELLARLRYNKEEATNAFIAKLKPEVAQDVFQLVEELRATQSSTEDASLNQEDELPVFGGAELLQVLPADDIAIISLFESQLQIAREYLGSVIWRKLESKTWSDRKEAFVDIEKLISQDKIALSNASPGQTQQKFAMYCACVHAYLSDSISPVVNAAMDCFLALVKVYGTQVDFRGEAVRDTLIQVILQLCNVIHKSNTRMCRAASRCVIRLTRIPQNNVHPLRYILSCIFQSGMDPVGQMHLLRLLIPEFGFQTDGIDPNRVIACVVHALSHGSEKARKISLDVAMCTQRLMGSEFVLRQAKCVKAGTFKELEKLFQETENIRLENATRPQTVHFHLTGPSDSSSMDSPKIAMPKPPVQERIGGTYGRVLHSAPVGSSSLQYSTSPHDHEDPQSFGALSCEDENMMDSILNMT